MNSYGSRKQESIETRSLAESVIERVYLAVEQLCVGQGDVRKRLITAVMTLLPLQEEEFPEELRSDFRWVISQSTRYKSEYPQYRGDLEATMSRIRNSTGEKIAKRIFTIYSRLQDIRGFPLLEYRNPND
jgi:hypothetical protein